MNNNKITDIINYDIPKFNVDIKYQYAYYDEVLEDLNPVNHISINLKDTNINLNMYNEIRIDISEFKNRYRFDSNFSFLNNIDPKIIEKIKSYQKKNLYTSTDDSSQLPLISYFNNPAVDNDIDDKFISIVSNQSERDRSNIMSAFNITSQSTGINTDFSTQKFFRNYNVSKEYLYDFFIGKTNNLYNSEMKNVDFFSTYSNEENQKLTSNYNSRVFNIDKSISSRQNMLGFNLLSGFFNYQDSLEQDRNEIDHDQTVIFEKLKHFYIVPPYEDPIKMRQETGVAFVGFIINKNTIIGQTKNKAGAQFVYVDINNLNNANEIVLFDDMIRYSSSYTYEISPVFLLSLYKHNGVTELQNIPLMVFNLLYTHSYRSNKIFSYDYFSPEPPNGFHINTKRKKVTSVELKWSHPTNPQQDVIGFQIYRRRLLTEPFTLIKVMLMKEISQFAYFKPSDNYEGLNDLFFIPDANKNISGNNILNKMSNEMYEFIDDSVDFIKDTYVYAICSIDAHGMISNYSNQIGVRYSTIYNTLLVDHVSDQNAPRTYPNLYVKRKTQFFKNDDILFDFTPNFLNKQEVSIYFTPDLFDIRKSVNDQTPNPVFTKQNEYQFNLTRLTDLENKSIIFKFI